MNEQSITVELHTDFCQKRRILPFCEKAQLFCLLTGNKEFSPNQIDYIKQLGFTIKVHKPDLPDYL